MVAVGRVSEKERHSAKKRVEWQNESQKIQNFSPLFAARICSTHTFRKCRTSIHADNSHTHAHMSTCICADEEHVCCKVNIWSCIDFARFLLWFLRSADQQNKEETKKWTERKNCCQLHDDVFSHVRQRQMESREHQDLFQSIRLSSSNSSSSSRAEKCTFAFDVIQDHEKTPSYHCWWCCTKRCACCLFESDQQQVKICQSMRPNAWLPSWLYRSAKCDFVSRSFCSTAGKLRNRNGMKKQRSHSHRYTHTRISNRFFHSHIHLTNNLIFDTAIRVPSNTHILFAEWCFVRSNPYKSWRKCRRENEFSTCAQCRAQTQCTNGPPTKWLQLYKEWESQRSAYSTHRTIDAGPGIAKWLVLVCIRCLHVYIVGMNGWMDGWINLYVCPVSLCYMRVYACMSEWASEWVAG